MEVIASGLETGVHKGYGIEQYKRKIMNSVINFI